MIIYTSLSFKGKDLLVEAILLRIWQAFSKFCWMARNRGLSSRMKIWRMKEMPAGIEAIIRSSLQWVGSRFGIRAMATAMTKISPKLNSAPIATTRIALDFRVLTSSCKELAIGIMHPMHMPVRARKSTKVQNSGIKAEENPAKNNKNENISIGFFLPYLSPIGPDTRVPIIIPT